MTIMNTGLLRFFCLLGYLVLVSYQIFPVDATACESSKLRYIFELHPLKDELNQLFKLMEAEKSMIPKRFIMEERPVRVIVTPEEFPKFYRNARALKIYRSHWKQCIESNKSKSHTVLNIEPTVPLPVYDQMFAENKLILSTNLNAETIPSVSSEEQIPANKPAQSPSSTYINNGIPLSSNSVGDDQYIRRPENTENEPEQINIYNRTQPVIERIPFRKQYLTPKRRILRKRKPKFHKLQAMKNRKFAKKKACSADDEECKMNSLNVTTKFFNSGASESKNLRKMRFVPLNVNGQRLNHRMKMEEEFNEGQVQRNIKRNSDTMFRKSYENNNGPSLKDMPSRNNINKKNKLKMKKRIGSMEKGMKKKLNTNRVREVIDPAENSMKQESMETKNGDIFTKIFRKISKRTVSISNVEESRLQAIPKRNILKPRSILKPMVTNTTTLVDSTERKFQQVDGSQQGDTRNHLLGRLADNEMSRRNNSQASWKPRMPMRMMPMKKMAHSLSDRQEGKLKTFGEGAFHHHHHRSLHPTGRDWFKWRPYSGNHKNEKSSRIRRQSDTDIRMFANKDHYLRPVATQPEIGNENQEPELTFAFRDEGISES